MKHYLNGFKDLFANKQRATREQFWMFFLFHTIVFVISALIDEKVYAIYWIVSIIPYLSLAIRRLHDSNRSGWWLLVPIINIVFLLSRGDEGSNDYGPKPL